MTDDEFASVFERHKDAVYRFAWRMTASPTEAEDISQDVFLALLRHPARFDPARGSMRAFLLGIARNVALKRWRDANRWEPLLEDEHVIVTIDTTSGVADAVASAVRSLPPLQREVLILAEYEELSLEEIARAVQSEIGTVKSRLHRARHNLKRALAPLRSGQQQRQPHGTV